MQEKLSVCVLLPSGCLDKECSRIKVGENLSELIVEVKCPDYFVDVHSLLSNKVVLPKNHPKFVGFHRFFQGYRKKNSDPIIAKASIPLEFEVQKNILCIYRLGKKNGLRVIYVELVASKTSDYNDIDCDDFVLCD